MNYWIFQGKRKSYDFDTSVKQNLLEEWNVKAHWKNMEDGDKVIIWLTGKDAGCYALAYIIGVPEFSGVAKDNHLWNINDETGLKHKVEDKHTRKVKIQITQSLFKNPLLKNDIKNIKGLDKLKVGYRGTNFASTKEEYEIINSICKNRLNFC